MAKKSILKRAGYFGLSLILMLATVPVIPNGRAWAAGCTGEAAVADVAAGDTLTVCLADDQALDARVEVQGDLVLNLNGHTLTQNAVAAAFKVDGSLTIEGEGTITPGGGSAVVAGSSTGSVVVNGGTFGYRGAPIFNIAGANVTINGGDFTAADSVAKVVASGAPTISGGEFGFEPDAGWLTAGKKAYSLGTSWVVETPLTNADVVFPTGLTMYEGEVIADLTSDITVTNGSRTGFTFALADAADAEYTEVDAGGRILAKKEGDVEVVATSTFEPTVQGTVPVTILSGLTGISVADVTMLQEGEKRTVISNVYADAADPAYVTGVSYAVDLDNSNLPTGLTAHISGGGTGNKLVTNAGAAAKVEPGTYSVRVKALRNGVDTGIYQDVPVTVNALFSDFTLAQADAEGKISIRENQWFALTINSVAEDVVDINNVRVASIEVVDGGEIMHANEDRIAGDKKGVGTATIAVTAEYTSGDNVYTLTKNFTVEVTSVLQKIAIREASDTDNTGVKYGSLAGETDEILLDQNSTKDLRISVHKSDAAVDYEVTSSDATIADVTLDTETGNFTVAAKKAGTVDITVTVTPKGAVNGAGAITNSFKVTVYPILISAAPESEEVVVYEDETDKKVAVGTVVEEAVRDSVNWTYNVEDESVITVADDGTITPLRDGETFVTIAGAFTSPLGNNYAVTTTPIKVIAKSRLESIAVEDVHVKAGSRVELGVTVDAASVNPEYSYEFGDNTIARMSRAGGARVRGLKAGDTTLTVEATHFGKTVETTANVHVYEMVAPRRTTFYGKAGDEIEIDVHDKNENATVTTSVTSESGLGGFGLRVQGNKVRANLPGDYTVEYTDKMGNGETVDTYTATVKIYGLSAWAQPTRVIRVGEDFNYGILSFMTNGSLETVVKRDGRTIARSYSDEAIDIDTSVEGTYTIRIRNLSARRHGVDVADVEYEFYVVGEIEEEEIFVERGETVAITASSVWETDAAIDVTAWNEAMSERFGWMWNFMSRFTPVGSIDGAAFALDVEDGVVIFDTTDAELGEHVIQMSHDFGMGRQEVVKNATVVVYEVAPTPDDAMESDEDRGYVAGFVAGHIGSMIENGLRNDGQVVLSGSVDNLKEQLRNGEEVRTELKIRELEEEYVEFTAEAYDEIMATLGEDEHVATFYEALLRILVGDTFAGWVYELDTPITMRLLIPEAYRNAPAGYTRTFYVIRGHLAADDTESAERLEAERDGDYLVFENDKFSSFAITYVDTLNAVPDTGYTVSEGGSADSSLATVIATVVALTTLAGAVVFAKRR